MKCQARWCNAGVLYVAFAFLAVMYFYSFAVKIKVFAAHNIPEITARAISTLRLGQCINLNSTAINAKAFVAPSK